ncbi:RRP15-like protein isoform X1 [Lingula anatina]|uniref:RRP15-like protein n=1 Tax=Lingula anatina TaxID=7574 RepID=A0A1S3JM43_LINAN|nr:RRP15-like protein isoform X1 [Lingula anatina]|eukprot:XP_013411480.1 RRP15-like protein isoform X1 [Lingula anatina]
MAGKTADPFVKVSYDSGSDGDIESDVDPSDDGPSGTEVEELENKSNGLVENGNKKSTAVGWADAMTKILQKQIPKSKPVILAKAKTDKQIYLNKRTIENKTDVDSDLAVDSKNKAVTRTVKEKIREEQAEIRERKLKKRLWEEMNRVKPDILEKEKERSLQRIAQRGVVQLFNAVRKQQKDLEDKLKEAGSTEGKREKVMKSVTPGAFLDVLKGTESSKGAKKGDSKKAKMELDVPTTEPESPSWKVLRDDFMMGAKMKDWDQKADSDDNDDNEKS